MITCKTCKKLKTCTRLCQRVESLLPKDYTGKDSHREVNMDTDAFLAAAEVYSLVAWRHEEYVNKSPEYDLSGLSGREKRALLLMAKGVSQREAAALMAISRASFRTLIKRALGKLHVAHSAHLIEGQHKRRRSGKGGC
jgi:DNA-binding CsgD family transcriptional regulator